VERLLVQILVVVANIQVRLLEGRSGKRFRENSTWSRVSRS